MSHILNTCSKDQFIADSGTLNQTKHIISSSLWPLILVPPKTGHVYVFIFHHSLASVLYVCVSLCVLLCSFTHQASKIFRHFYKDVPSIFSLYSGLTGRSLESAQQCASSLSVGTVQFPPYCCVMCPLKGRLRCQSQRHSPAWSGPLSDFVCEAHESINKCSSLLPNNKRSLQSLQQSTNESNLSETQKEKMWLSLRHLLKTQSSAVLNTIKIQRSSIKE